MNARIAGVVVMAISLTGCETVKEYSLSYKLWSNSEMSSFAEPASDPRLALFANRGGEDVLVQYDETSEKKERIRRRAYFLEPNTERIAQHKKPRFVDPQGIATMNPVPQSQTRAGVTNVGPGQTSLAAWSENGRDFSLLRNGEVEGPFALPVYRESNGTLVRVTLTPFAVAGDTVMVGMVAAVIAFIGACEGGFFVSP
jgi:hypothetical protein